MSYARAFRNEKGTASQMPKSLTCSPGKEPIEAEESIYPMNVPVMLIDEKKQNNTLTLLEANRLE